MKKIFGLVLCLLLPLSAYSQSASPEIELKNRENSLLKLIHTFEKEHNVIFSYSNANVKKIRIKTNLNSLTIEGFQLLVASQTLLTLKKLSDLRYVLVVKEKLVHICGKISEKTSRKPLSSVIIFIEDSDKEIVTNQAGEFEAQLLKSDKLIIDHLGYDIKEMTVEKFEKDVCPDIFLEEQSEVLSEVLISDYLTKGIVKNKDGSLTVSPNNLSIMPGLTEPDVMQSLQLLPGINSPNENATGLYIRGGSSDHNLYLWDGIKMYHTGHLFDQVSAFNPYITKNVKVFRSGTSAKYGDRVSGVIDIKTDELVPKEVSGGIGVNLINADAFLKVPISKKTGFVFSARRSITDKIQTKPFNQILKKVLQLDSLRENISDFETNGGFVSKTKNYEAYFYDLTGKLIFDLTKKDKLQLSAIYIKSILNERTSGKRMLEDIQTTETDNLDTYSNLGASLNYHHHSTEKFKYNVSGFFSDYSKINNFESFVIYEKSGYDGTRVEKIINTVRDIGGTLLTTFQINKEQSWENGYQFGYNEVDVLNDTYNFGGSLNTHTFISEYFFSGKKTKVKIGSRLSQLSRINRTYFEPRLYASYTLGKLGRITGSAEIKNQMLNQLYTSGGRVNTGPQISLWTLGFRPLESGYKSYPTLPIRNKQITLGWMFNRKGWTIDLETYLKKLEGITSYGDNFVGNRYYTGFSDIYGLDLLIKKDYRNYRMWVSYSLSKNMINFPDFRKESFPGGSDKRHIFNFSQTYQIGDFELATGWAYSTGRPYPGAVSRVFKGNTTSLAYSEVGANNERLADYHRLDFSMIYRFNLDKTQRSNGMIGISLLNVYDQSSIIYKQVFPVLNSSSDTGYVPEEIDELSIEFMPNIVFRLNF